MKSKKKQNLDAYYEAAIKFTKSHYENFPVISLFVKRKLRKHVAAVYQFARQADDLADEGNIVPQRRIKNLNQYENYLTESLKNNFQNSFWNILKNTIDSKQLDSQNFFNLLKAFKQDVSKTRYKNYNELLDYCTNSADPVGRIILELNNVRGDETKHYSDKICTALQLTNFYQDVSVDIEKGRIYLPEEELMIFNVTEEEIKNGLFTDQFIRLMKYQLVRTRKLFSEGRTLLNYLPYLLKVQILVTIKGGEAILDKIEEQNYNVLEKRPTLSKMDFVKLFVSAIF